jgi:predicted metal-dependent hydrolase
MTNEFFHKGIEEFNQQEFYACHDTLEEIWMDSVEPSKTFYQGILQIAVGCYHLSNNNWRGAVILLGEGTRKLREYEPDYFEIDVSNLIENSYKLLTTLQQISPDSVAEFYQKLINNQLENNLTLPHINMII